MYRTTIIGLAFLAFVPGVASRAENWPQWRGARLDGVSQETNLPTRWSPTENIAWRVPLPGPGGATPVVWGDRIFVTSIDGDELVLLCISTEGKELWRRTVSQGNRDVRGDEGNSASPSPCTDGEHVWATFTDGTLTCFDFAGNERWKVSLPERFGEFKIQFGMTSTPVLDGDRLYLQLIHGDGDPKTREARVVALDKATGATVWESGRPSEAHTENEHSYASPVLYRDDEREFLLSHGADYIVAHDLNSGRELWRCGGLHPPSKYDPTLRFVASPVAVPGLVVVPSAKEGVLLALRPTGQGDVTNKADVHFWKHGMTPDVPSPLVLGDFVYLCRENGNLVVLDRTSGKQLYEERTHVHRHRASPVAADGKIYLTARDGTVSVCQLGEKFALLASNAMEESMSASPAISNGRIYLRTFAALYAVAAARSAQDATDKPPAQGQLGVLLNESRACPGYNLINPGRKQVYLYDNDGRVVQSWTSELTSGAAVYLLENGHLFRPAEAANRHPGFQGPAASGRFQEFDWDGNVVWDFEYHSDKRMPHHDAIKLPNGNLLAICWEWITEQEAIAAGRRPETVKDSHLQPDCLVEIKPTGPTTGEVVWEWRSWDHLIQDLDAAKANFGNVSEHPELFDVNYMRGEEGESSANRKEPDWMHVNSVAYNQELDQIALSSPHFDEIWIIDHSTTTEQAQGHTGGRWGKGGDILYRWGNPRTYRRGTSADQRLFFQHNVQWIAKGLPGEGRLLVFNNGGGRKPEEYSSVDELIPPTGPDGHYLVPEQGAFGPAEPTWSYSAPERKDFFSWFISGAQRLSNGNTLINSGAVGIVFEVTPEKETVWKFSNPFKPARRPDPPRRFQVLNPDSRRTLGMSESQNKQLDELDDQLLAELEKILTSDQLKILAEPNPSDGADFGKAAAGEYLTALNRSALQLTEAQRSALQTLRQNFDPKFAELLTDAQRMPVSELRKNLAAPPADGGTPRRRGNTLFRATRFAVDYPAFSGKTLQPGRTLVEIEAEFDRQQTEAEAAAHAKPASQ